jgi:hypothetical protein
MYNYRTEPHKVAVKEYNVAGLINFSIRTICIWIGSHFLQFRIYEYNNIKYLWTLFDFEFCTPYFIFISIQNSTEK